MGIPGLTNAWNNMTRAGERFVQKATGDLGVKMSHAATKTLKAVEKGAGVIEATVDIPPVQLMAGAVKSGAKVGQDVIEVGKDLDIAGTGRAGGKAGLEKAKKRVPGIVTESGKVAMNVEAAAVFA